VDGVAQPYKFITYAEAQEQTAWIASAFKSLGLKRGDKICILGSNCPEWMLAMQVCS
jgi:long-chain acyl-CoA synthetase